MSAGLRARARRLLVCCAVAFPGFAFVAAAQPVPAPPAGDAARLTHDYVVEFYPLWFTYNQRHARNTNVMVGPDKVTPIYQTVVAINVDTLYASSFLDLSSEPAVLTVPKTDVTYSVLGLDPYGDVFKTGIDTEARGIYLLTGPGYQGNPPDKVKAIQIPYANTILIFRADKHTSSGQDVERAAEQFREGLKLQTLSQWKQNPKGGAAKILREIFFAKPFKTIADATIAKNPIQFLQQLQTAVAAPQTPPMSARQKTLSDGFNALFKARKSDLPFALGAKTAHADILNDYLKHTGATQWIHFLNIGVWGANESLDRSAITEFIQYGNDIKAAAYYQSFNDGSGNPLDGTDPKGYVLQIPKDKIPQAKRFWSFTLYTPQSIELAKNEAAKYAVASYTNNLKTNPDGSITIAIARTRPAGVPEPNWLPAPKGPFNVMLRVYGPEGSVADDTYVPPAIVKR